MGCGGSKAAGDASSAGAFNQTLVILRHSERKDQVDPAFLETEEHKAWPFDTPLTENGIKLAHDVAVELANDNKTAKFNVIVSSPYRRCMQTAAEVAKVLKLPVLLDQEMGEVWDKDMPKERPPHRSPVELVAMAKELGIEVKNPLLPEGGFKLFGKVPKNYPEVTKDGHKRCLVRVEYYIMESQANKMNYIIVSHAPAVAAMMNLFEHGMCDIEKLDYCATVLAARNVRKSQATKAADHSSSVFAQQWDVSSRRITTGVNLEGDEEQHQKYCDETLEMSRNRLRQNTVSDVQLRDLMKSVAADDKL